MHECAVFLSRLDFSVLLMAGGIKTIPCFALPEAKDVAEKQMIETIYGLTRNGFLQIEEQGAVLMPELSELIQWIKNAKTYLYMEPGMADQPQRIVYLGNQAVILENTTDEKEQLRLFSKERTVFWKWVEEAFDMPAPDAASMEEALELVYLNEAAQKERERLQAFGYPGLVPSIRAWVEKVEDDLGEAPYVGLRFIRMADGKVCQDLVLFPGCMNTWFLWCDPGRDGLSETGDHLEIAPDSIEIRNEIQKLFWGKIE